MIKAVGSTGDGTPLVILGLSGENMTRLMAKEPMRLNLADLGLPATVVVIVGGRTENDIADELVAQGLLPAEARDALRLDGTGEAPWTTS